MAALGEYVRLLAPQRPLDALGAWAGRFTRAREAGLYLECETLLRIIKRQSLPAYGRAVVPYSEGWLNDRLGRRREAIAAYQASLDAFRQAGIPALDAQLWSAIGSLHQDGGDWTAAEEAYRRALAIADEHGNRQARGGVLHNLGGLFLIRHHRDEAEKYLIEAAALRAEAGDRSNAAATLMALGSVQRERGRPQQALETFVRAAHEFQAVGDRHGVANALGNVALLYQVCDRLPEADAQYGVVLSLFSEMGDLAGVARTLANLALVSEQRGDGRLAVERAEEALACYRDLDDNYGQVTVLVNLALLHTRRDEADRAEIRAGEARALAERWGYDDQIRRLGELVPPSAIGSDDG